MPAHVTVSASVLAVGGVLLGGCGKSSDPCPSDWTDSSKFDCQLYEGAKWCDPSTGNKQGSGWCTTDKKCDATSVDSGGYGLTGQQVRGWGTFSDYTGRWSSLDATEVCAGCGSSCAPLPPVRPTLNTIADGCIDYSAWNGQIWRDNSGYTCGSYHHGQFCIKDGSTWKAGKLFEGYGSFSTYTNLAMQGSSKVSMDPLQACCTCGGGSQCTNGWKPPAGSDCVREFEYQGKAYSGCTIVANAEVGEGAWCSSKTKYEAGAWTKCDACSASVIEVSV